MFGFSNLQLAGIVCLLVFAYIVIFALVGANRAASSPRERSVDDQDQSDSMRALLQAAENDLHSRTRLKAGTLPTINQGSK
jgi:hypothetical protein